MEAREQPSIMSDVLHISPSSKFSWTILAKDLLLLLCKSSLQLHMSKLWNSFFPIQTSWVSLHTQAGGASVTCDSLSHDSTSRHRARSVLSNPARHVSDWLYKRLKAIRFRLIWRQKSEFKPKRNNLCEWEIEDSLGFDLANWIFWKYV